MIGSFKPNTQTKVNWRSVHVTESKIEALQYSLQYEGSFMSSFVSNNKQLDIYVSYFLESSTYIDDYTKYFLESDTTVNLYQDYQQLFFHVFAPSKTTNIETERPLYDQIVQQEAMELHYKFCFCKNNKRTIDRGLKHL
jgi:hypothetical protein